MVHERIKALREGLEKRKKATKAKSRAKARERTRGAKARAKAERERRIQQGSPKGVREHAATVAKETSEAASSAKEAVSAERQFIAQELGVSTEHAGDIAETATRVFDAAGKAGVDAPAFDLDGDGDTDILQTLDQPLEGLESPRDLSIDPTEPVVDFRGTTEDPLFNDTPSLDVDADSPSPGEITFGRGRNRDGTGDDLGL